MLITIIQQSKNNQYWLGKDNMNTALELLEAMRHLFVDTPHNVPLPPNILGHPTPELLTGPVNIATLQSLLCITEDNVVCCLQNAANSPSVAVPTATSMTQPSPSVQRVRPIAERP